MEDSFKYKLYGVKKKMLAYIIVNETFSGTQGNRNGASQDFKNMQELFSLLNFDVVIVKNQTAFEMYDILKQAMVRPDIGDVTCFACVISTHGEQWQPRHIHRNHVKDENVLIGVDGKRIRTQSLLNIVAKCPSLSGKPKLFFIQACRSGVGFNQFDDGVDIKVHSASLPKDLTMSEDFEDMNLNGSISVNCETKQNELSDTKSRVSSGQNKDQCSGKEVCVGQEFTESNTTLQEDQTLPLKHSIDIECNSDIDSLSNKANDAESKDLFSCDYFTIPVLPADDMLIMFASPEGQFAWRNARTGGWLLSKVYAVVKQHIRHNTLYETDFLSVLTEVARVVAADMQSQTSDVETDNKKMCPVMEHRLTKDILF